MQALKRTPLYGAHRRGGAKMVEFAGWEMPVQYRGVMDEHVAVRTRAGLFDVSHMGEIMIRGPGALELSQKISANDVSRMKLQQAQYNLLMNEKGGIVDDVIFYRIEADCFLICVNASNSDKDFAWIRKHAGENVELENASSRYAQLALQGPLAVKILQPLTSLKLGEIEPFYFEFGEVSSMRCLVARTGYTGEDGFELYCEPAEAEALWQVLLERGRPQGLEPAGLGARDTLRLEKAYPLYGHELDGTTTPLEAGLSWVTKLTKGPFVGRDALLEQKQAGIRRKLVGLELLEPGIARHGYELFKNGRSIGRVTSGTKSPTLGKAIALAYVTIDEALLGNAIAVEIRGRKALAEIVAVPFYRR
ncbi:MAG TPA: glycine cleavage system aminomethyltransferase GcvT [Candidatus Binatia bacterium]|nr:glycine cleavage system aminomethyltransferase GcvT [Candidatus Binatia bacterium]